MKVIKQRGQTWSNVVKRGFEEIHIDLNRHNGCHRDGGQSNTCPVIGQI